MTLDQLPTSHQPKASPPLASCIAFRVDQLTIEDRTYINCVALVLPWVTLVWQCLMISVSTRMVLYNNGFGMKTVTTPNQYEDDDPNTLLLWTVRT